MRYKFAKVFKLAFSKNNALLTKVDTITKILSLTSWLFSNQLLYLTSLIDN